jgi:hypothetical protein
MSRATSPSDRRRKNKEWPLVITLVQPKNLNQFSEDMLFHSRRRFLPFHKIFGT